MKYFSKKINVQSKKLRAAQKNIQAKKSGGFTIVETLVAITILIISITGPMFIISQALKASYYARDQITAFYLAQEAIEYLRNSRDNVGLQGGSGVVAANWLNGISTDSTGTLINPAGSSLIKMQLLRNPSGVYSFVRCTPSNACPKIKVDANGVLGSDNSSGSDKDTVYVREVSFSYTPSDPTASREIAVYAKVSWNTGGITNSVGIREYITNWQLEQ